MSGRLHHMMLGLLKLTLWFLSTWYGTFVICGTRSLSGRFPYFRRLSEVPQGRREQILLSWSSSPLHLFRHLFKSLKSLVLLIYFTQVGRNIIASLPYLPLVSIDCGRNFSFDVTGTYLRRTLARWRSQEPGGKGERGIFPSPRASDEML